MIANHKLQFLLKNLGRAVIYAALLAVAFLIFKEYFFNPNKEVWLSHFYSNPLLVYAIYVGSELFFGLFPPEIFMIWALHKGPLPQYIWHVTFFALVSYGAGYLAFLIGRFLKRVVFFRYMTRKFFIRYWPLLRKYGSVLLITAAITPLPWSTVSMMIGTSEYPARRFLFFASFRILRFALYGFIIYHTR